MRVDYLAVAPEIVLAIGLSLVLLIDLGLRGRSRRATGWISLYTIALAFGFVIANWGSAPRSTLGDMFVLDGFSIVFKLLMLGGAALVVVLSMGPMSGHRYEGEYYFLFLSAVLGTILMPSSRDLVMLFIALELVSAPAFVIAGLRKQNARSNEAALKYFLIGVLSAGILVYGISLVYGFAGTTRLDLIARQATTANPLLLTGIIFIVAGFGFKVSAVPFHFWAPDTYEGSPTPLAAFLSVASKAAGFVGLFLILLLGFPSLSNYWGPVVGAMAIATMTLGNVLALKQTHLVRLLGYSSIAQGGYMLIPLALIAPSGISPLGGSNGALLQGLAVYLVVYTVMNLGAFSVAIGLSKSYPALLIRDLTNLGRRAPLHAAALAVFFISLAGIPPFAGWAAKFFVFMSALSVATPLGVVLASVMVVNSVISLYYYLGVARKMFLDRSSTQDPVVFPGLSTAVTSICLLGTIAIGIFPQPVVELARAARIAVFG